jgi:hypothetical protein
MHKGQSQKCWWVDGSCPGVSGVHARLGGVLLHGGMAGVWGVGLFLLCEFVLLRVLGGVVAGVVIGGVVALHLLRVLGGGAVRTAARAHGVLRS